MLNCHIVRDLLPSYTDGLVSAETAEEIEQHLQACAECRALHEKLRAPISGLPPQTSLKEINFLKKIRMKTFKVKAIAGVLAVVLIVFGFLAWVFAIGTAVSSENIIIETEIQKPSYGTFLGQEWVVHFNLTNGKALVPWSKPVMSVNADGTKINPGYIIKLYQAPATNLMHESNNYTWGYSVQGEKAPETDFTLTVRLKDKDIIYSMTEEGLFELQ